mmetsp:Transcript_25034/g.65269  ORF Transcript_25034/g.65269 Transcript_25034/m.65269 type:complete len:100 (+) Transcript_25034:79-378(+)
MAAVDYLFAVEVTEADAEAMDKGSGPAILHRVTVPRGDGKVLWGHGMIDSGRDEVEGEWVEVAEIEKAPHVHSSIAAHFNKVLLERNLAGAAPVMYTRK